MTDEPRCQNCMNKIVLDKFSVIVIIFFLGFMSYTIGIVNERKKQEAYHNEYVKDALDSSREGRNELREAYDYRLGGCEGSLKTIANLGKKYYEGKEFNLNNKDDQEFLLDVVSNVWIDYYEYYLFIPDPLID